MWGMGGYGGMICVDGMVVWWYAPYRNQTQATPHQGGQYCKKSYVGGDNNIERTQARRRAPAPPGACRRASIYMQDLHALSLLVTTHSA